MTTNLVHIIDYGMGNIWSIIGAIEHLGYEAELVSSPEKILESKLLILPGVGSFRKAMESLKKDSLDKAIKDAVLSGNAKLLGICLGMQLLCRKSSEDGDTEGLGLMPYDVDLFTSREDHHLKVPHVGFNEVNFSDSSRIFAGIKKNSTFYFVHSYKIEPQPLSSALESSCLYGKEFVAAFEKDNIFGTQFHPEKSQTSGLRLLENFLSL